jgi:hypothetical protein
MVLALVKRRRKVSFGVAWHALHSNGVRMIRKARATRLTCFKVIKDLSISFPSLTPIS